MFEKDRRGGITTEAGFCVGCEMFREYSAMVEDKPICKKCKEILDDNNE